MHMLINAVILAVTLPGDPADLAREVPTCTADYRDGVVRARVEFADGYTVEAPWRVLHARSGALRDGSEGRIVNAVLERIVERDALTGKRRLTPFEQGVSTTFRGRDRQDVADRAAALWCSTVMRMNGGTHRFAPPVLPPLRMAVAPKPSAQAG